MKTEQAVALKRDYLRHAMRKPRVRGLSVDARIVRQALARIIRADTPEVKYPLPEWCYSLVHLLTPQAAIDMVILDRDDRVLYVQRNDRWFTGFELVGGYGRTHFGSMAEWCNYLSKRDIGAMVKLLGFAGIHLWKLGEHAHGVPISMVAVCRLTSNPTKHTDKIRFFRGVPQRMVPNHGRFVRVAMRAYRRGALIPEI